MAMWCQPDAFVASFCFYSVCMCTGKHLQGEWCVLGKGQQLVWYIRCQGRRVDWIRRSRGEN